MPALVVAAETGVNGSAHVPRNGLRPLLLLYFAAPSTPISAAANSVGTQCLNTVCAPTVLADSGRWGAQRSEVKEEGEARGTRTELSTPSA